MQTEGRAVRIAVVALTLLALGAIGAPTGAVVDSATIRAGDGVPSTAPDGEVAAVGSVDAAVQANNTTVRHRNPDEASEDGDLDEIQAWLSGRMGERLTESSIHLTEGQYELAREVVGEDYRRQLGKYVDVAGETEDESDDRAGTAFERAGEDQSEFASDVRAYEETYEEYEEAREEGDDAEARELARELERLATEVNGTAADLADSYGIVSNETGVDLEDAEENVDSVAANVSGRQAELRAAEFVETELSAEAESDRATFLDPLTVTGRLTTANGTPLSDGRVVLETEDATLAATTEEDGTFALEYRPTRAPIGETTLALAYVPQNTSVYLGSTANATTTVEQVQPTVELSDHADEVGFGEPVGASGSVAADGIGAPGVPLVVEVGGVEVETIETDDDGSFAVDSALPAAVPPGERRLEVRLALRDRALAVANDSATVSVERTETVLSLSVVRAEGRTLDVAGQLRTADGEPVPGQSVRLLANDSAVTTVTTGPNGTYEGSVTVPPSLVADGEAGTVVVAARFDGAGTNLESADDTTTIEVDVPASAGPGDDPSPLGAEHLGVPWWGWGVLGALLVLGAGAGYWYRTPGTPSGDDGHVGTGAEQGETDDSGGGPSSGPSPLFALARDRLGGGRVDEAVEAAYGAARRQLEGGLVHATPRTHWEFYRACREAGLDPNRLDALERLTELYERAAFTRDSVPTDVAGDALGVANDVVAPTRGEGHAPSSDD